MNAAKFRFLFYAAALLSTNFRAAGQGHGPEIGHQVNVAHNVDTLDRAEPLNHLVNTAYEELGPILTHDGKRLYFSRQGYPGNTGGAEDEDIWYSEFDEITETWTKAIGIGPPLNNRGHNFITGVGVNDDTVMVGNVYGKRGKMKAGVSISVRVGNLWSFPVPIKIEHDYNLNEQTAFDLTPDRNALLIAQQKADSYGGLDLYVSFRDPDTKYPYSGKASVNLGPVINTFGNETSPWMSDDGRTLFFASDGHTGYGGLDIFMSTRLDDTWSNWTEPVNLGPGINSFNDDFSFNYNSNSRYAYFVRGVSPRNTDIYRVELTRLFTDFKEALAHPGLQKTPILIGETDIVNDVFDDDSNLIRSEVLGNLDSVAEFLKENPGMVIQISAHSNPHPTRDESFSLSTSRAKAVFDFLVQHGVNEKQLGYHGLGHDIVVNFEPNGENIASSVEFELVGLRKQASY